MLSRRDLVRLGLLGGAAALLPKGAIGQVRTSGCGGGCGGGGMGGGGTIIDPPPGSALKDLSTLNTAGDTTNVALDVRLAPVNVNGVTANLYTYNGASPGGIIQVSQGDTLNVTFTNSLPVTSARNVLGFTRNVTNLHVHGMHVSPMEPADAAHIAVLPGTLSGDRVSDGVYQGLYRYKYDLSLQDPGCLHFYHSHSHGLVAEQHWGGLAGPIVVADGAADPAGALAGLVTHVLVLKDISLSGTDPTPHTSSMDYMNGLEGNTVMVNGQVNPVVSVAPGEVVRWRVVNASNARFYKLSLEGHSLYVIGTDGGLLDKPYAQSYVIVSPGERVDLLVKASTTRKNYRLLSLPYSRMGMMSSAQITLMTMTVTGNAVNGQIPAAINPNAVRLDTKRLRISATRTYTLSMGMGRGYINGHDFDVTPDETMTAMGSYEVWNVVNQSNMDHPWHQHVNAAQVLSITGGDSAYRTLYTATPARKDVVIVPKGGSISLLVPAMDWTGMTMYHCHILEHEDIGMMGMWHIM